MMVYPGGILYENAPYPDPSVSLQATNANQNQHGTLTKLSRTTNPQACIFYTPVPSSPPQFNSPTSMSRHIQRLGMGIEECFIPSSLYITYE
ncbi:hypothetical protein FALBO_8158 [Fusarium albosuccineum]|uniref:Uncharacterized protein n=1 Tax=Fusarium albosuccineum TaxID=1237068 RepID=A0A8H4PJI6_9HYPO|nr:hypothetical protein FALBO_8158 [Fusarium albosuccineum]